MKVFIFLGPTLSWQDARTEFDATYLPPVAQGDLYRAAREKPFAIGIIDGYFERLPAVWHKEILWALSQRIHVFGAASMGALRAAELARFGMQGVGEIYQAFASGKIEDDDEVAVAHGDASSGFRAASEAMVNIRATLAQAQAQGAIAGDFRRRIETLAKDTFYPERSYPHILARGRRRGCPRRSSKRCALSWLRTGWIRSGWMRRRYFAPYATAARRASHPTRPLSRSSTLKPGIRWWIGRNRSLPSRSKQPRCRPNFWPPRCGCWVTRVTGFWREAMPDWRLACWRSADLCRT